MSQDEETGPEGRRMRVVDGRCVRIEIDHRTLEDPVPPVNQYVRQVIYQGGQPDAVLTGAECIPGLMLGDRVHAELWAFRDEAVPGTETARWIAVKVG